MSREYISAAIAPIPISPADLQKSNLSPQTLLNTFEGKTPGSTVAASFQSNLVFLSGFPDQCLLDSRTFCSWVPHFLPLAEMIIAHYSNKKIDVATLTAWLLRDKPILHAYHKGFGLIIQLPRLRWFSPDGYLNVHQPAPDGNPYVPWFHVPPAKVHKAFIAL